MPGPSKFVGGVRSLCQPSDRTSAEHRHQAVGGWQYKAHAQNELDIDASILLEIEAGKNSLLLTGGKEITPKPRDLESASWQFFLGS